MRAVRVDRPSAEQMPDGFLRQHDGSRLHQQARRNSLSTTVCEDVVSSPLVSEAQHSSLRLTYSGQGECYSGCVVERPCESGRVVTTPGFTEFFLK